MWLIFLSRSTERQARHEGKSVVPDSKKAELTNIFCTCNFFVFIFMKYEFFTYLACIYFCKRRLKENFACTFVNSTIICEICEKIYTRKSVHLR